MPLSRNDIQKALRIENAVKEYFANSHETKVQVKKLMGFFIKKEIFSNNNQDGLPIRSFLRFLNENDSLYLIPSAHYEEKGINKNWYFIKPSNI